MSALVHAAFHFARDADPQWVDRPHLSPSIISSADFSITTAPSQISDMDGAIYDVYPDTAVATQTAATTTLAALATGVAKATATAVATAPAAPTGNDDDNGECRLLGSFALFVQLALGGLALMSLVYKRWRERPQRPVKIWFFDVSKQVFGSVLVHIANVFMSMLTSGRFSVKVEPAVVSTAAMFIKRVSGADSGDDGEYVPNPCSFYLLNLAIDTTLGIPILILLLRIFTVLVAKTRFGQPPESIQSGNYGSPPNALWWLKQSLIYFCGLFGMKFCVLIIFIMLPWISRVGDWALGWTEGNEKVQIVFVMMLFPLIMNALQYYIIDSFIKKQTTDEGTEGPSHPGSDGVRYQSLPEGSPDSLDHGHQQHPEDIDVKTPVRRSAPSTPVHQEYDPEVDGDRSALGSSSSSNRETNKVPAELYPKE